MDEKYIELIRAWIQLSAILKNSRLTKELSYNEAVVMLQLYQADGKPISIRQITANTRMLKSQVNRTINALEEKGLLRRCESTGDRRVGYVQYVPERLEVFLRVHAETIEIASKISSIIGPEDTDHFIRIVEKLTQAGYQQK